MKNLSTIAGQILLSMDDIAIYNKSRELPGHMRPIVGQL